MIFLFEGYQFNGFLFALQCVVHDLTLLIGNHCVITPVYEQHRHIDGIDELERRDRI